MSLDKLRATGFEPEDAMVALERYPGRSDLGPPVVVLEAADVVLADVVAALHLDDHQLLVVRVGDAVRRPEADVDRVTGLRDDGLAVDDAGGRAGDDDPVLGAVLVGLVAQPLARLPRGCA